MRQVTIRSRLGELAGFRNEDIAFFDLYDQQAGRDVRHFVLLKENIKLMYEPWGWLKKEWYADFIAIDYPEDEIIELTDLYLDLYIEENGPTYRMIDFDDLAEALMNNETSISRLYEPLKNLQRFLDNHLHKGKDFPPEMIRPYMK